MKGIGIVNLVHSTGAEYYPIDFRVYAPQAGGLTKNEHFRDLLRQAYDEKGIQAETILFDSGYAVAENLKFIHRLNKIFVTTLKEKRLVSLRPGDGYFHLQQSGVDARATSTGHSGQAQRSSLQSAAFQGGRPKR